jgi:hypothetical protein
MSVSMDSIERTVRDVRADGAFLCVRLGTGAPVVDALTVFIFHRLALPGTMLHVLFSLVLLAVHATLVLW